MYKFLSTLAIITALTACTTNANITVNPSANPDASSSASPQPAASAGLSVGAGVTVGSGLSAEPWKSKQGWVNYLSCLKTAETGMSAAIDAWIAGANTISDANWAVSGATSAKILFSSASKQYPGKCLN